MRKIAVAAFAILASLALARWVGPENVPFERLLEGAKSRLAKNPNDAGANYFLARVYSVGFAQEGGEVAVNRGSGDDFPRYVDIQVDRVDKPLSDNAKKWLKESVTYYYRAAHQDSANGLYALGYGWMLEQMAVRFKEATGGKGFGPYPTEKDLWAKVASEYRRAFRVTKDADLKQESLGSHPNAAVSQEAASNILRLAKAGKTRIVKSEESRLKNHIKTLEAKPHWITPLIFPVDRRTPFESLIDDTRFVPFDLDGTGRTQVWSWVKPNAGFLVWDPKATGKIKSGRQMFGNATFWMFFRDGFDALGSLDKNQDGWLKGAELSGLAVWRDLDSDGISDPGEVRPLSAYRVAALRTKFNDLRMGMKFAHGGVVYSDGGQATMYDWIARSGTRVSGPKRGGVTPTITANRLR